MKRALSIAFIVLALTSSMGFAATYSANGAGATGAYSVIGTGPFTSDYASLEAAAADFQSVGTGLAGNYTFYFQGNLAVNNIVAGVGQGGVFFGRATNGFSLTFKPASGETPTITFGILDDNNGPSGGWLIGTNNPQALDSTVDMSNVVIDGSNTIGGTTRDLTINTTTNFATSLLPAHTAGGGFPVLLHFYGDVDNSGIKNCNVSLNTLDTFLATPARSIYAVRFGHRRNATTLTDEVPDNDFVRNCNISAVGGRQAQGVAWTGSGTLVTASSVGTLVENNTIIGRTRGMLLNSNRDYIVQNNVLRCNQTDPLGGLVSTPFVHAAAGPGTGTWTMIIRNNVCDQIQSAANAAGGGVSGMQLTGAPAGTGTEYQVYNNILTGFVLSNPATGDFVYRGIETGSSFSSIELHHNSINMPESVALGTTYNRVGAVVATSTNAANTFAARNNIIRYLESGTLGAIYVKANNTLPTQCIGNNIYAPNLAGSIFARLNNNAVAQRATLAGWQASGEDTAAGRFQQVDPTATAPGAWDATLHFVGGLPSPMKGAVPLASIATDIDGDSRAFLYTYPGADEQLNFSLPIELSVFSAD